jgi:hypothetical protein
MKQKLKWLSVFCLFINIIQMYFIYIIPKNDSVSGPFLWLVFSVPIMIIQVILFLRFLVTEEHKKRQLLILGILNFVLTALPFGILLQYY